MNTLSTLWSILTRPQQRSSLFLLGMMLVCTALETIGVGLAMPAVMLMVAADSTAAQSGLGKWLQVAGDMTRQQRILAGMAVLVGVYAVKAVFLSAFAWVQARFVNTLQANLSRQLFIGYLRQPYSFHLQRNSAELIQNTIGQAHVVGSVVHQGLNSAAELLVLVSISVMLIVVEPFGTFVVGVTLVLAGWGLNVFTRDYVVRWGSSAQWHDRMRLQHLQQGLGGVKEVKLLGREVDFADKFKRHTDEYARINVKQGTAQQLPRLWLELLAVFGLATLAVVVVTQGKSVEMVLPTMGLFAAATFRLMPSANRLFGALQGVRFSTSSVDTIFRELRMFASTPAADGRGLLPFIAFITLRNVSYRYPGSSSLALSHIDLRIEKGASIGFVGGSGAGKSTLVDIVLGLLTPESGTVEVDGCDVQTDIRGWQNQIGYVPQSIFLTDDTLRRNIAFGLPDRDICEDAIQRAVRSAQLEELVESLPEGMETLVGERGVRLSGGQRQRIGIARALYHDPAVLVLDEATSALDPVTETSVMDSVAALGHNKTVLVVAHRWSTVARCGRIYRIERGCVIDEHVTTPAGVPIP